MGAKSKFDMFSILFFNYYVLADASSCLSKPWWFKFQKEQKISIFLPYVVWIFFLNLGILESFSALLGSIRLNFEKCLLYFMLTLWDTPYCISFFFKALIDSEMCLHHLKWKGWQMSKFWKKIAGIPNLHLLLRFTNQENFTS